MKNTYNDIIGVVLAGGKSTRYGSRCKALLEIEGETLYQKTINKLATVFDEIIIITNTPEIFPLDKYKKYPDIIKNIGPIGGIHAALTNIPENKSAFITAVDMPFLEAEMIRTIINCYQQTKPAILIPRIGNYIEPLHAVYHRDILVKLDEFIRHTEKFSIRSFFNLVETKYFQLEDHKVHRKTFFNINTPEQFADPLYFIDKPLQDRKNIDKEL